MDLATGTVLGGRYEIVRLLGQGGMGSVYEVRHTGTRKRMALKVITADVTQHPGLVARFEVEARASGAIESQHIAQVFDVGSDEHLKVPYMAMEFLVGEDLEALLQRLGPLPPDLALRVITQACAGLERAHENDVIHRDIKPANIYVTRRDGDEIVIKLLDFGIAKIMQDEEKDGPGLTRTGALIGSPLYMSPEQARGRRGGIDQRTDVWSLGTVLYQILCGRTPHHDQEAMGDLIIAICSDEAVSVQKFAPWIPPEIDRIIQRALQIDVEKRYQSAGEMLRDLRALLPNGSSITAAMLAPVDEATRSTIAMRADGHDTEADDALSLKLETGPGASKTTLQSAGKTERPAAPGSPTALSPGQPAGGPAPPPEAPPEPAAVATTSIPQVTSGALTRDAAPPKSSNTPLIAGGIVVALLAGVLAAFAMFGGDPKPAPASGVTATPTDGAASPTAATEVPPATPSAATSVGPEITPSAPAPGDSAAPSTAPPPRPTAAPVPPRPTAAPPATTAAPAPTPSTKKNPLDVTIK